MKLVLTGASGFVGAHLLRHFAERHLVTVIGRPAAPLAAMRPYLNRYVQADLRQNTPELEADLCIHAAGLAADAVPYQTLHEANTIGTRRLFQSVHCRHFIYISSASVYNDTEGIHRETDDINPERLSAYGKSKRLAELFLLNHPGNTPAITILRPRAVYGPGDRVLLPRLLGLGRRGRLVLPGHLRVQTSMTHIQNLVSAIELISAGKSVNGIGIYNVADNQPYTLKAVLLEVLEKVYEQKFQFHPLPEKPLYLLASLLERFGIKSRLSAQAIRYLTRDTVLDISAIQRDLGYLPPQNFVQAMPELADWVHRTGLQKVRSADPALPWAL